MTINTLFIATNGLLGPQGAGSTISTATVSATFGTQQLATQFDGALAATILNDAVGLSVVASELVSDVEGAVSATVENDTLTTETC